MVFKDGIINWNVVSLNQANFNQLKKMSRDIYFEARSFSPFKWTL